MLNIFKLAYKYSHCIIFGTCIKLFFCNLDSHIFPIGLGHLAPACIYRSYRTALLIVLWDNKLFKRAVNFKSPQLSINGIFGSKIALKRQGFYSNCTRTMVN